jgi:plastocyanin
MRARSRMQVARAFGLSLAVIAAGCGSESGSSPVGASEASQPDGPSEVFSPGPVQTAPGGAIVHTVVFLQSHLPQMPGHYGSDPAGSYPSYSWDFGDGTFATGGESISHVYAIEGTFLARVTTTSGSGPQQAMSIRVSSLTGRWSGNDGRVSLTQEGLELRGRYLDDPRAGSVEGRVSMNGTVTFTITRPGLDAVTFTGRAGRDVMTLEGTAKGRDAVDRPWKLTRG